MATPQRQSDLWQTRRLQSLPEFHLGKRCACIYSLKAFGEFYKWQFVSATSGIIVAVIMTILDVGGTVQVPLGVFAGLGFALALGCLPYSLRRCVDTCGCLIAFDRFFGAANNLTKHDFASNGSGLSECQSTLGVSLYLKPMVDPSLHNPLPQLDLHPLLGNIPPFFKSLWPEEAKDWFRLFQKASVDTLTAHDIRHASVQQVRLLLTPLLLDVDLAHLAQGLATHIEHDENISFKAFCICRAHGALDTRVNLFDVDKRKRYESWVAYFEDLTKHELSNIVAAPTDLASPFCIGVFRSPWKALSKVHVERRFSSGHGPTLLRLEYETSNLVTASRSEAPPSVAKERSETVGQKNSCSEQDSSPGSNKSVDICYQGSHIGAVVEVAIDGVWHRGVAAAIHSDGSIDFRSSTGALSKRDVPLANVRQWPMHLLLKPDAVINDAIVVAMFRVCNFLWRHSFIPKEFKPCAVDFEVLPAGLTFGFIEYLEACTSARDFDWAKLEELTEEQLRVFLRTAAGSIVAGHVLGIGDRHMDNIMLQRCDCVAGVAEPGECIKFVQIDFKHCFGKRARIDANAIAVPLGMKESLRKLPCSVPSSRVLSHESRSLNRLPDGGDFPLGNRWDELKALCGMAYRVLRRSNGFIIHMCRLLSKGSEFSWSEIERHLNKALNLGVSEEDAVGRLCDCVETSPHAIAKAVKDISHNLAARKSSSSVNSDQGAFGQWSPTSNVGVNQPPTTYTL